MISPHTPPGTKVVCSNEGVQTTYKDTPVVTSYFLGLITKTRTERHKVEQRSPLRVGQQYTIASIRFKSSTSLPWNNTGGQFCAILSEVPGTGVCLSLLDYAVLPESLTSILKTQPVDDPYIDAIEKIREMTE